MQGCQVLQHAPVRGRGGVQRAAGRPRAPAAHLLLRLHGLHAHRLHAGGAAGAAALHAAAEAAGLGHQCRLHDAAAVGSRGRWEDAAGAMAALHQAILR